MARSLMMVALLPRGLIGGLGDNPDAVSYAESKHTSTLVPQTACAQLCRLVSMLTTSLDDFSLLGARLGAQLAQGDDAETDLCMLLTDWRTRGANHTPAATTGPSKCQCSRRHRPVRRVGGIGRNQAIEWRDDVALDR